MLLFKTVSDLSAYLNSLSNSSQSIGFVPTMGALHQGHLSLIDAAREKCAITVCSIFVNPTQFNDPKDFEKYPVTLEQDIYKLEQQGTDVLFLPGVHEIYPDNKYKERIYNIGYLESILEGKYRPGHFLGVCQVVDRLFAIVKPTDVFFGQKDYQQCMVIQQLVQQYHPAIHMHLQPTMRETDSLAMSSRNMRLNATERTQAAALYKALQHIVHHKSVYTIPVLIVQAKEILYTAGFEKIDYIQVAEAATLKIIEDWNASDNYIVLGAAFLGGVRLIDNIVFSNT